MEVAAHSLALGLLYESMKVIAALNLFERFRAPTTDEKSERTEGCRGLQMRNRVQDLRS